MAESHPNLHAEIRMLWWAVTVTDAETLECTGRVLALIDLTSGERDLDWGGGKIERERPRTPTTRLSLQGSLAQELPKG